MIDLQVSSFITLKYFIILNEGTPDVSPRALNNEH